MCYENHLCSRHHPALRHDSASRPRPPRAAAARPTCASPAQCWLESTARQCSRASATRRCPQRPAWSRSSSEGERCRTPWSDDGNSAMRTERRHARVLERQNASWCSNFIVMFRRSRGVAWNAGTERSAARRKPTRVSHLRRFETLFETAKATPFQRVVGEFGTVSADVRAETDRKLQRPLSLRRPCERAG